MIKGIGKRLSTYCGRIGLEKSMLAGSFALILIALIGGSMAATTGSLVGPGSYEEKSISFTFEQSVQNSGYHMTYLYAKAGNVAIKNYAHGSGSLNSDATLTYQRLNRQNHPLYTDYNDFTQNCIQFKEDVSMVYAPMNIAVGTGYYAANPLDYSSLLKEKTWVKNYRAGTSMHHEVEYAHALDKVLEINAKEKFNYTYDPVWEGDGYTQMKINEDVTDGKAHIGVLQSNIDYAGKLASDGKTPLSDFTSLKGLGSGILSSAWKNPAIEIDEDYWGTSHIDKNMTLEVPYYKKTSSDDWLPCCFGGYLTMPTSYLGDAKLKSAKGVFDCSCFKAPNQAQFPRVY
ncbi:MAG: hypothetical protein PHW87_10130 [Methanothrix sp.]|nr:hypothetical protein [Methanothrix sp.]